MAAAQDDCRFLSHESPHHFLTLHPIPLPNSINSIICDISHGIPRPVPPSFRKVVFDSLHSPSHPGIRATQKLVSQRFVWPKMYSLIKRWAQSCLPCQRSKVVRHTNSPVASFLHQMLDLTTFISTLWVLFPLLMDRRTCSHVSIGSLAGQRLSLSQISLLPLLPALWFLGGLHVLVFPQLSLQTEVVSLSHPFGHNLCQYWALLVAAPHPTIHSLMVWWNGFIVS